MVEDIAHIIRNGLSPISKKKKKKDFNRYFQKNPKSLMNKTRFLVSFITEKLKTGSLLYAVIYLQDCQRLKSLTVSTVVGMLGPVRVLRLRVNWYFGKLFGLTW